MRTPGPGDVVPNLVVVGFVDPGRPVCGVLRSRRLLELDRRNAVVRIRTREDPVECEARGGRQRSPKAGLGQNIDTVAVIVEGYLIQQRRADRMRKVDYSAVRGIAKRVADRGYVVTTPHGGSERLINLLGHPVSEDRDLVIELVVGPGYLFAHVRRRIVAALELIAGCGQRENLRRQQSRRIGIDHAGWNRVVGKGRS